VPAAGFPARLANFAGGAWSHQEDRMTARTDTSRIDLRAAKLCIELDCNTIFDAVVHRNCPTCGSLECYPLETWLNRERAPSMAGRGLGATRGNTASRLSPPPPAPWPARLRDERDERAERSVPRPLTLRPRGPRGRLDD
jgi:hypothetical protein